MQQFFLISNYLQLGASYKKLLTNTVWLLSTEIVAKVSRIATLIALSIGLTSAEYGLGMLAIACHEIIRIVMRCGAGTQIVQCDNTHLTAYIENGKSIQYGVAIGLCLAQLGIGHLLGIFYDSSILADLIQCMAFTYLLFPVVSIQVFLNQRAGNMRYLSVRNACCIITENLLVAILAISGVGLWSLVIGKFVFALLWVGLFIQFPIARYPVRFEPKTIKHLLITSTSLLGTEFVKSTRQHYDIFIAGKVLSPEVLGIYAFAKSAGVGLSQSLSYSLNSALFPHFCQQIRDKAHNIFSKKILLGVAIVACAFLMQAWAAEFYIPVLFDNRWDQAISTVSVLCIAAVPVLFVDVYCTFCRAQGKYHHELTTRVIFTIVSVAILVMFRPTNPEAFASVILWGACFGCIVIAIVALFYKSKVQFSAFKGK